MISARLGTWPGRFQARVPNSGYVLLNGVHERGLSMPKIPQPIAGPYADEPSTSVCSTEAELLYAYGGHALAFFDLTPENRRFLAPHGAGLVTYRLTRRVAVVPGDPICAPEAIEQVTRSFLDFCAGQHWRVAFYQASAEHFVTYHALKLRAFKMGEEAIIHPQTFTLHGSALANVRTSCRRAERDGVHLQWYEGIPPAEVMQQLESVSGTWLQLKGGKLAAEMGFSTGKLHDLVASAELAERIANVATPSIDAPTAVPRFVTGVATTRSGQACAFVTFTPIYGLHIGQTTAADERQEKLRWGWALDLMRRTPDAPPGVMEWLLVQAIERFRSSGAQVLSLGLVAMADTLHDMTPGERRLAGFLPERLGLLENRRTLFNFKQKFDPCWESRYLVANTTVALPKIALALLRLRNYQGGRLTRLLTTAIPF